MQSRDRLDATLLAHCRLTLSSCHWLQGFRINPLAGSICLHYPEHKRLELNRLLERALTPPLPGSGLDFSDPSAALIAPGRPLIRHGAACTSILLIDALIPLPLILLLGLSTVLLWPRFKATLDQLRRGRLKVEALELGFSTALMLQGLPRETLTNLGIHDATDAVQGVMQPQDDHLDGDRLLERLGQVVQLQPPEGEGDPIPLGEAREGQRFLIHPEQICPLHSLVDEGRLLVSNRRINGDWQPRWLKPGDRVPTGSFVIRGQGILKLKAELFSDPTYALLHEQHDRQPLETGLIDRRLKQLSEWLNPTLLAGGGVMLARGAGDAALAALRFNPLHNWNDSVTAARMTAVADLALHQVRIRNPNVLSSLGRIRHLVITQSSLFHTNGILLQEELDTDSGLESGTLLQLMAGIQTWLSGVGGMAIWSTALEEIDEATPVRSVTVEAQSRSFKVLTEAGDRIMVKAISNGGILQPLHVSSEGRSLGKVLLTLKPDAHWLEGAEELARLGIRLHVVSTLPTEQLRSSCEALNLPNDQLHGNCDAQERLALIRRLQGDKGEGVAYMGYLLKDLAALEQADLSIGMDVDDDSLMVARLCDLTIPTNAAWLPRMVRVSRRLQVAESRNFGLITGTQIASAFATASGWIAPMQTILLYDLPMLVAELNNILSVQSAGYATSSASPFSRENRRQLAR